MGDLMKICVIYDCLYPYTVGGGERWYRQLASAYAAEGHEVTYLTLRQWESGYQPILEGVKVIAVGPRMALYANGIRRILPPLIFGIGVLLHLLRHGRRYNFVHGASFPFFSILAAGLIRPLAGYQLVIDWLEVWTREYWHIYLGPLGRVGWIIQRLCATIPHTGFTFSRLHQQRAEELIGRPVTFLPGMVTDEKIGTGSPMRIPREIVYAGRLIPEKRVGLLIKALPIVMEALPDIQATILGMGPEYDRLNTLVAELGLSGRVSMPGFVDAEELEDVIRGAAVLVQPSEREGYGMVVIEAAARGVPVVVVAAPDNAAVELVEESVNGSISQNDKPETLADAIISSIQSSDNLRKSTRYWYNYNSKKLMFSSSFSIIQRKLKIHEINASAQ
nr:glycosyltransferase family 4 protein [Sphingomonas sp. CDS-1]